MDAMGLLREKYEGACGARRKAQGARRKGRKGRKGFK